MDTKQILETSPPWIEGEICNTIADRKPAMAMKQQQQQ